MNGTITFYSLEQLAEFLKHFTGATSTFEIKEDNSRRWILTFLGGF
jgi:hypothetical protein